MKGIIASGHSLTSKAASDMFAAGGNAFDAVVAAGFASVVTEPTLTSLGGGGFLLAHSEKEKKDILFDFFVNFPGLGSITDKKPAMTPVDINFPGCVQTFHTGIASAAVPGMLKGLMHIHERLCTLPLETVVRPAMFYLEDGVEINERQGVLLGLLKPIFTSTEYGKKIFLKNGHYVKYKDRLFNPALRNFFRELVKGCCEIYRGDAADRLIREMYEHNGMITREDLEAYNVVEREPLRINYRDREILTNHLPASGGIMLAVALHLLEKIDIAPASRNPERILIPLIEAMKETYSFRMRNGSMPEYPFSDSDMAPHIKSFIKELSEKTFISTQGTTHISIMDRQGNAASMTTSNGSGSGYFIPETGIMLNNMMGEDDLHPEGFFTSPPNQRVSSMMLPTMILKDGMVESVMGSGGSKRIRTAILQVIVNIIDRKMSLQEAVESSRVHFEDNLVHIEPDFAKKTVKALSKHYNVRRWEQKDMYFGGVHCVNSSMQGWGDSRRGGSFMSVNAEF